MVETSPPLSIGRRLAKGAAWMIVMRLAVRAIGLVSTIVLARLLMPEDFGLIAMAMVLVGLIEALSEFSFEAFLIREQRAERAHYDTAFTLAVLRGLAAAALIALAARPAAAFYGEPRLEAVVYVLAAAAAIGGLANVGTVDFRKELRFHKDFQFLVASKLCTFVATVVLAFAWRSYWALAVGTVLGALARVVLSYALSPYRPRFSLARMGEVLHFSKWLLAANVTNFLAAKSDALVIGRLIGAAPLGLYTIAYEIATLPTSELVMPIRRALLPGYARIAEDRQRLRRAFLDGLALIVMLAAPFAVGVGLVAEPLVRLAIGDKWVPAIPLVQVLAAVGMLQICHANTFPVYVASGRPQLSTAVVAVQFAAAIGLLLWFTGLWGALGAAFAMVAATALALAVNLALVRRLLGFAWGALAAALWRSLGAVAVMAAIVLACAEVLGPAASTRGLALRLVAEVVAGALAYLGAHLALWRLAGAPQGPEAQVLALARARLAPATVRER